MEDNLIRLLFSDVDFNECILEKKKIIELLLIGLNNKWLINFLESKMQLSLQ